MTKLKELSFEFRNIDFKGLKFGIDSKEYPWKTDKEAEEFFNKLIKDGSYLSKLKYKNLVKDQILQDIHVNLTYSLVAKVLSLVSLSILLVIGLKFMIIATAVIFGISFTSYMLFNYFKRRANELFIGKEMCSELVDVLFNNK